MISGVSYKRITEQGLEVILDGKPKLLEVDNIIICAGQEPMKDLGHVLETADRPYYFIGGADVAKELDAKRAIDQGMRLACKL